jgi:hypothetical protein
MSNESVFKTDKNLFYYLTELSMDSVDENKGVVLKETKNAIIAFIAAIKKNNFDADVNNIDLKMDDEHFDCCYYDVEITNPRGAKESYVSIRIDMDKREYWITADCGYYVIGQKRSIDGNYEDTLIRIISSLLDDSPLDG